MATTKNNSSRGNNETINISEAFFNKYRKPILYGVVAVIVIIAAVILYHNYEAKENIKASTELAKGQQYFAMGAYDKALNGDGTDFFGFTKIAKTYSSTDAGNLANLYAGLCYAQLGKYSDAQKYLEDFDEQDDQMISPAAEGALGNVYAHLNQLDKAVEMLKKAADDADNNSLSPTYLIQAGQILESQGKNEDAVELYKKIKQKYVNSMQFQEIDKYIERASQK
jgi:tetratricopeptide (TPR) repeat protein